VPAGLVAAAEAIEAEDGTVLPGDKGDLRHLAALGADRRVHLPATAAAEAGKGAIVDVALQRRGAAPVMSPGAAAGRATLRLVQEAARGVK